ncbi:MAG: 2Fe-2S iron-sulfur cluster-binding protein, partial [Coriobacteriia bacterium]|nr:2Fe-2S iron-sulfur cluster-binding protein [Coriobacteriia bacterium]
MPKVTFIPDDVTVHVADGENLLRAAMIADVPVTASCGGDGTCGKCRVVVQEGSVEATSSAKLTDEQVSQGYVLACTAAVTGDVTVRIPPESRPGTVPARHKARREANVIL